MRGSESRSNLGQDIRFSTSRSQRTRASLTFSRATRRNVSFYLGTGAEYEEDGEREAWVSGRRLIPTTRRGASFSFEGGLDFRPSMASPFSIDLSFQGYAGRKKGISGSLNLSYSF